VWRHRPEYRRPRHFHQEPELNLVVRGRARIGVGESELALSDGDFLVFQPGQDHVLFEASDDLELFVLALAPELAERALGIRALSTCHRATLAREELGELTAELRAIGEARDAAAVERRLGDAFALACRKSEPRHVVSRRTLEQAREEPALSGTALARHARVAVSTLSSRFRRDLGVSLVEYRARVKLMRFIELVDAGASSSRAAVDADFGSYAQCHRVFRRALGCAPRDYFNGKRRLIDEELATPDDAST
jgi:AraC-like DNA-binding protein